MFAWGRAGWRGRECFTLLFSTNRCSWWRRLRRYGMQLLRNFFYHLRCLSFVVAEAAPWTDTSHYWFYFQEWSYIVYSWIGPLVELAAWAMLCEWQCHCFFLFWRSLAEVFYFARRGWKGSSCKPHHSSLLFQSNYANECWFFLWFVSVRFVRHWIDALP